MLLNYIVTAVVIPSDNALKGVCKTFPALPRKGGLQAGVVSSPHFTPPLRSKKLPSQTIC